MYSSSRRVILVASVCLAVLSGTAAFAQDTAGASATTGVQRYGGYLFRDVNGDPLPFQSDEAIEEFLATADVVSSEKIPVGVTAPRKLELSKDGVTAHAAFKYVNEEQRNVRDRTAGKNTFYLIWRDWYGYDLAAYHVDRLLALDRVPPIVERKLKRLDGSVQIWLEGVMTAADRQKENLDPPDPRDWRLQKSTLHIFDNLVANRDSNLGNALIDENWHIWFIDCSRCFGNNDDLLYPEVINHCERKLWKALRELDMEQVRARLDPYLTVHEMQALMHRRDKLVDHIQGLIDTWGEEMILFDMP